MLHAIHHRIHGPGEPIHEAVDSALRVAGLVIATILGLLLVFLGVLGSRAS